VTTQTPEPVSRALKCRSGESDWSETIFSRPSCCCPRAPQPCRRRAPGPRRATSRVGDAVIPRRGPARLLRRVVTDQLEESPLESSTGLRQAPSESARASAGAPPGRAAERQLAHSRTRIAPCGRLLRTAATYLLAVPFAFTVATSLRDPEGTHRAGRRPRIACVPPARTYRLEFRAEERALRPGRLPPAGPCPTLRCTLPVYCRSTPAPPRRAHGRERLGLEHLGGLHENGIPIRVSTRTAERSARFFRRRSSSTTGGRFAPRAPKGNRGADPHLCVSPA